MSDKKNPLGPTGETVRRNFVRLRGGMQYKELAERLAKIGRPIPALGLRRIEAGERRVDADDLVALAVAFDVSPLTLLLPADGAFDLASPMTGVPDREVAHNTQWSWALGREPLELVSGGMSREADEQQKLFQLRSVPAIDNRQIPGLPLGRDYDLAEENDRMRRLARTQGFLFEDEPGEEPFWNVPADEGSGE
ncbi:helix-turn-helix domain-containing protein [Pseudarthrobacter sp. NamE5]|uniref:helix-turn-helix domain-containing protein n=1 Tax=Pseudarthrobacter sp. NamE5 TaxID=2576839 RepID=UPI00197AA797|nr:helix-turn-helix transcriptional regulator [Pseudarthrobacter sp. NamE5]